RFGAKNVGEPPSHTRAKIQAERTEYKHHATRHVFTTVLAYTFHHGKRSTVANRKSFPGSSRNKKLAGSRSVQNGVAGKHIPSARCARPGRNRNRAAGKPLTDVVVRFPGQLQRHAAR